MLRRAAAASLVSLLSSVDTFDSVSRGNKVCHHQYDHVSYVNRVFEIYFALAPSANNPKVGNEPLDGADVALHKQRLLAVSFVFR